MKEWKAIIVEDEPGAAASLQLMIGETSPHIKIVATLTSIEQSVAWLDRNTPPDLGFFDIQLEDGPSFAIFENTTIDFPVVFTTAFDQYAIDAFKVNSIDYLLKPIKENDLSGCLKKFERLTKDHFSNSTIHRILESIQGAVTTTAFLVHYKNKLIPLAASDIAFFYTANGIVHGNTYTGLAYPIGSTLDELEQSLGQHQFFRANRQFLVNKKAIKDLEFYFNGRLSVNTQPPAKERILVSKARVPVLKEWMASPHPLPFS
jgi:DNA-binding LytR/AlgR family response regulator